MSARRKKFYANAFYNANDTGRQERCECGAIMKDGICQNYGHDSDNFRTIEEIRAGQALPKEYQ